MKSNTYIYIMKCLLLCFVFIGLLNSIGKSQVLNPTYIESRIVAIPQNNIQWQSINLENHKAWSYQLLSNAYPTATLTISFFGIEKLKYKTCLSHTCTPWSEIKPDPHINDENSTNANKALIFFNPGHDKIIFDFDEKHSASDHINVALRYFDYFNENKTITKVSDRNCTCTPLTFKNRVQWNCPDTEQSSLFIPEYTEHTHIVIHHQAGSANPPYDNVVKAIWDYHVNGNGWSDIGYNWLIAPDGTIYKGRSWLNGDQNVRGAHTCSCNSNKLGICLLGDLTNNLPTPAQYESLKNFIVWKACELDILPDIGSAVTSSKSGVCIEEFVHHITGHRDNCGAGYTACPGDRFYPTLESLKQEIIVKYYNCIDTLNTATQNLKFANEFSFYPNPNDGRFNIDLHTASTICIYDLLGQCMRQYNLNEGKHWIETYLPFGTYMINIKSNDGNVTSKMSIN